MNNETNSPQSVISDLSSDLMHYVRKRKREQPGEQNCSSNISNISVTPTDPRLGEWDSLGSTFREGFVAKFIFQSVRQFPYYRPCLIQMLIHLIWWDCFVREAFSRMHNPLKKKRPAMLGPGSGNMAGPDGIPHPSNGSQIRLIRTVCIPHS